MAAESAAIPHWYDPDSELLDITHGEGARIYDADGNEYLDFLSQLYCVNAGFDNGAIINAIHDQVNRIPYVAPSKHNDARTRLANRLAEVGPDSLSDVYFAISGSEANESAVQFAREYMDAPKVLTRWRSYHGSTYGAASLTGDPSTRAAVEKYAATTGAAKFLPPVAYRSPFNIDDPEELTEAAGDHLEFVIRNEGPDSIAAILMEPVAGAAGGYTAPPGYFERVRELCDEYDILLISDEVITGFGRCGEWFGIQTEPVQPDMLTFAKAVTSGYVPLAGVMTNPDIGGFLRDEGIAVGQTFGGHAVACAAGVAALGEYEGGLLDNVRDLAPAFEEKLHALGEKYDAIGDVRGRGFLRGIEFTDPNTGEPFVDPYGENADQNPITKLVSTAEDNGLIIGRGRPPVQIMMAPPFCIDEADLDEAVEILDASIAEVF